MLLQVARRLRRSSIGCFDVAPTRPAMIAPNSNRSSTSDWGCSLDAVEGKSLGVKREMWVERARRRSEMCGQRGRSGGA
jgi:hypothetical protein